MTKTCFVNLEFPATSNVFNNWDFIAERIWKYSEMLLPRAEDGRKGNFNVAISWISSQAAATFVDNFCIQTTRQLITSRQQIHKMFFITRIKLTHYDHHPQKLKISIVLQLALLNSAQRSFGLREIPRCQLWVFKKFWIT